MQKVRWGVLSTANIATGQVLPAMQQGTYCEIAAIASRSPEKARAAAAQLGIPKAYGSYEALLADPEIDAIYNPLPNHLHVPWSIRAAEAGKHVLCEKPIGLSSAEAAQLIAARELVQSGAIGDLRLIQGHFSYTNTDPSNVRNIAEWGGGALMDIGCYPITLSRMLFNAE